MLSVLERAGLERAAILVVDDHRPTLEAFRAILEPLGHRIALADSAVAALRLIAREAFGAILCDVRMPGMDGLEMLGRLRARGLAKGTPIMLLSATELGRDEVRRAHALGAVDCLNKPTDPEIFRWRVGALVSLYEQGGRQQANPVGGRDDALAERSAAILQEAERLISRKDTFVGILGHDLRNPLSAILLGCKRLAQAPDVPSKYKATMDRVVHAAVRMEHMIQDILDFARTSSGVTFPISSRSANVEEIGTLVIDELREGHPDRPIAFAIAGDPLVECDPERIAQALGNLVMNAIQHGDGPIGVSAHCDANQITIEVHNAGAPIPEDALPTLFDPFKRRDERPGGLGLGLHIVKEIVHAHGGSVAVRSSKAEGTAFEIRWPRQPIAVAAE